MPSIYDFIPALNNTDFIIGEDDFSDLSINPMPNAEMYYFRSQKKALITRFVIRRTEQIEKSVTITLTKNSNGKYSPRFDFSIFNVTKKALGEYKKSTIDQSKLTVKAKVSLTDHESSEAFNELLAYLSVISDIELDNITYKTVTEDYVQGLEQALDAVSKDEVLKALSSKYKGKLTVKEVSLLLKRKEALELFQKLLNDKDYFEEVRKELGENKRPEDVWQNFFNNNQWIFGYGLRLVSTESIDEKKLEQVTTGANIFEGAGKRVDGLLRTKGYFGSLVFAEIKTDLKALLLGTPYRPPDTYRVSGEVIGGVAQVQKTAYKAVRKMGSAFEKHYNSDGSYSGIDYSTIKPIQILVIGNLNQLTTGGEINTEMLSSFELYRKSNTDVEIITFDELYERAKYIVG